MSRYQEEFPKGSKVRVKDRATLEAFQKNWRLHHPVTERHLAYAKREGKVTAVSFYHGGDVLYSIEAMPGLWHEACLESAS